jgi:hypothetical protein
MSAFPCHLRHYRQPLEKTAEEKTSNNEGELINMNIPPKAIQQLRASKAAADKLSAAVRRGRRTWTAEQEGQLSLIFEVIKETHDALFNIVEANR